MMTNQRPVPAFPKARWLLIPAILLLLFLNAVLICGGFLRFGPLMGLLIDITGASLLAVPDVPLLWRQTYSGRLQYAKDSLKGTGEGSFSILYRPGIRFHSHHNYTGFLELMDSLEPILQDGLGEHTHNTYFIKDGLNLSEIDSVTQTHSTDVGLFNNPRDSDRTGYAGWSSGIMEPDSAQFFVPTNIVNKRLTGQIAKQKSRIRRAGLGLLILGFIQQTLFI